MSDHAQSTRNEDYLAGYEALKEYVRSWLKPGLLQLRAGEMTAQEVRTVHAILNAILARQPLEDEAEVTAWVRSLPAYDGSISSVALREALEEWRAARRAFLDLPPLQQNERVPPDIWNRLAAAESKLFSLPQSQGGEQ